METHEPTLTITPTLIPADLITSILLYLPPKPLAKFKSVSKSWLSLINSPHFISLHIKNSIQNPNLSLSLAVLTGHTKPVPFNQGYDANDDVNEGNTNTNKTQNQLLIVHLTALDQPPFNLPLPQTLTIKTLRQDSDIIGSCHGLLCISNYPSWLALINPTTRTHQVLPVGKTPLKLKESHWVDFGFGFDHSTKDYKVVRIQQVNKGGNSAPPTRKVSVFSLKRGSWKRVNDGFPFFLCHPKGHAKFVNNSLYWLASTTPPTIYDLKGYVQIMGYGDLTPYEYVVVAFDLASETFNLVGLPDYVYGGAKKKKKNKLNLPRLSLWVLDGRDLCVMVVHGELRGRVLDVWVKRDYSEKGCWSKVVSRFRWQESRESGFPMRPITISRGLNGGEELLFEQDCEFFWYELGTGKTRNVKTDALPSTFTLVCGHPYSYGPVAYIESLVTLQDCDGRSIKKETCGNDAAKEGEKKCENLEDNESLREDFLSMGLEHNCEEFVAAPAFH